MLHLLTDDTSVNEDNYWDLISASVEAGIDVLQLRFKYKNKKRFYEMAKRLQPYLFQNKVCFLINDHVDIALAVNADGVHVGQSDLPVSVARQLLGPKKLLGLSISSTTELHTSTLRDANYLGVGPVFKSPTKEKSFMGLQTLKSICEKAPIPCIAVGGITTFNATSTIKAGATGIAVSSAITHSPSPYQATKHLLEQL